MEKKKQKNEYLHTHTKKHKLTKKKKICSAQYII